MPHALAVPLRAERLGDATAYRAAARLYTRVFGYDTPDLSVNPNLLSALVRNGGSAVGVYTATDELIGFAYGFPGRDAAGRDFHYSQAAVVDPRHQGHGVGRMLKDCQRRIAREWGHDTMRWTFDPLLARNAYFNFSALGAEGIAFASDYYDRPGTDRVVVEWALNRERDPYAALRTLEPPTFAPADWGRVVGTRVVASDGSPHEVWWLPLPADRTDRADAGHHAGHHAEGADATGASTAVRAALAALLDGHHVLVACRRTDVHTAVYLAAPRATAAPPEEGQAPR